ncbi:MAG: hypothetical protein RR140_03885 [Clostridia bacterium]
MKKNVVLGIISSVFRMFVVFLISLVWLRYLLYDFSLSLALAICLTISFEVILIAVRKKRLIQNRQKEEDKKKEEGYANYFIFNDDSSAVNFFFMLAKKKHNAIKKSKYILIIHPNSKIVVFPFFTFRDFCADDLSYIFSALKNVEFDRLVVCASKVSAECEMLSKKFDKKTVILDRHGCYVLMKDYNIFPEKVIMPLENPKLTFFQLLQFAFCKQRTKGYFFASVLLLLSSFLVRQNIYYVIMSSILLLLSLIAYSNPKFNKKEEKKEVLS